MNSKRLILSIILGIIMSSLLFTILITINLSSIDYVNFGTAKEFRMLGQTYLKVKMIDREVVKNVISGPIAISGILFSGLTYGIFTLLKKNSKKR